MTDRPNKTIDDLLEDYIMQKNVEWWKSREEAKSALKQLILDSLPPKESVTKAKGIGDQQYNDFMNGWNHCLQESIDRINKLFE